MRTAEVVVSDDVDVDVTLVSLQSGPVIVLRRMQSFSNAVEQLSKIYPDEHPDVIRKLVRRHLPNALDFDVIVSETAPPEWVRGVDQSRPRGRMGWKGRLVTVGAAAVIVSTAAAGYVVAADKDDAPVPAMTETTFFKRVFTQAGLSCTPVDEDDATCTDKLGRPVRIAMRDGGSHGPDVYWVRDGEAVSVILVFATSPEAREWAAQLPNQRMWPELEVAGRYVLGSSVPGDVATYKHAVLEYALGKPEAAPLPPVGLG